MNEALTDMINRYQHLIDTNTFNNFYYPTRLHEKSSIEDKIKELKKLTK